jgi:O-antigen/teichoic acid export membrane protein
MFAKIKSLMKQSAVYGLGTIAARAVAFLMLPYYTHLMSKEEYGKYALFLVFIGIMQQVYLHGMDIAFIRFSSNETDENKSRDLGSVLIQTFVVGGFFSALTYYFAPHVAKVIVFSSGPSEILVAKICAAILLIDTLGFHLFTYLRIKNRPGLFSIFKLSNVFVNIGLNILFVGFMKMGVVGAYWAFLASSGAVFVGLMIIIGSQIKFSWKWLRAKEWLIFGLPNLPSMIFYMAVEFSDRKWIEGLLGVDEAGIYSAGYRIGMLMNMVAQAFRYAWQPFFMQTSNDEDARETFALVLTYYVAFAGWIWLGATLLLGDLLRMQLPGIGSLIAPEFWAGFSVFPIIMLAHIFNGIYANFMVGIYIQKKTKVIPLIVGISAVVNIVGNGLLIPVFGIMASAWLTVVSYVIMAVGLFIYIAPRYKVPYEWDRLIKIVITVTVAWGVSTIFTADGSWIPKTFIVISLPFVWFRYLLNERERSGLLRRLRIK